MNALGAPFLYDPYPSHFQALVKPVQNSGYVSSFNIVSHFYTALLLQTQPDVTSFRNELSDV